MGGLVAVDVSSHQGAVTWNAVAAGGFTFAYLKATEGGDFTDARFAANWRDAQAAHLDRGAYHFFTLCTPGARQARHFLDTVPPGGELAPAVDLELAGNCAARPAPADAMRELRAFVDAVSSQTATPVVLYIGADFAASYPQVLDVPGPTWQLRFLRRPRRTSLDDLAGDRPRARGGHRR